MRFCHALTALLAWCTLLFASSPLTAQPADARPTGSARVTVRGFAPDAVIAVDGTPVAAGQWTGDVAPGQHLVQVYKPGGPSYDFPFTAVAGQEIRLPPPEPATPPPAAPPPEPEAPKKRYLNQGLYVLGQLGFSALTADPDRFDYELVRDEDSGQMRERGGVMWWAGAAVGQRFTRGFGLGGLVMYGSGGGDGTYTELRSGPTGSLSHTGPAELSLQFVRLGPQFRFMAGGNRARFLASISVGGSYQMVDIVHADVVEQGGVLVKQGETEDSGSGLGPYWGFDLGAEFNVGDHVLLGASFDFYLDRTNGISGDPYGGTAQGYVGFSARVGFHDWRAE